MNGAAFTATERHIRQCDGYTGGVQVRVTSGTFRNRLQAPTASASLPILPLLRTLLNQPYWRTGLGTRTLSDFCSPRAPDPHSHVFRAKMFEPEVQYLTQTSMHCARHEVLKLKYVGPLPDVVRRVVCSVPTTPTIRWATILRNRLMMGCIS